MLSKKTSSWSPDQTEDLCRLLKLKDYTIRQASHIGLIIDDLLRLDDSFIWPWLSFIRKDKAFCICVDINPFIFGLQGIIELISILIIVFDYLWEFEV